MPVSQHDIHGLLAATLSPPSPSSPNPEVELSKLELVPGLVPALFQVATTPTDSQVALVAAIYLKNLVRREWQHVCLATPPRRPRVHSALPADDKAMLRDNLVPAMATVDSKIRAQFAETLKRIISADFPLRYPQLLPMILQAMHSSDPNAVEAGLIALRALAKVYEFKGAALASRSQTLQEDTHVDVPSFEGGVNFEFLHQHPRAALNLIVQETFPRLLQIMNGLETDVSLGKDKPYEMQRTICKIFWSFTQYDLPTFLVGDLEGVFSKWMTTFLEAMRKPVPYPQPAQADINKPVQDDELRRMPQWKVKQWIGHIVYRLFQRYSNPSRLNPSLRRNFDMETLVRFGDFFRKTFAAPFTGAMLEILGWDQRYISPRVANLALLYLESAVSPSITYLVIKPRLADLVTNVIFPYLCISEPDLALWGEDPVEYVRKTYDVLEDFNTPRAAACSLLFILSKYRRSVVISPLLGFLVRILEAYAECRQKLAATGGNDEQARQQLQTLARQKDGALLAIGTIRETLVSNPQNSHYLEALLNVHVVDDFESDIPFLRARACWLYGQLTASESVSIQAVLPGLKGVEKCLRDEEFPVRVRAAVDIRHFLQNKVAAEKIAPHLGDLLTLLFTLLDDIDNTDIVGTIDQVVVGFSDQVAPFAAPLCSRLVDTFSRAASAGQGDDEAGFAAVQCIQALESIVMSVASSEVPNKIALLGEVERTIAQVFDHMFEEDRIEYFEEALELLAMFVFHSATERGSYLRGAGITESPDALLRLAKESNDVSGIEFLQANPGITEAMQQDTIAGGGAISPYLWSLFPRAMHAFHDWASDYSFHYLHLVDSYLSKTPRVFLCNRGGETSYIQLLLGMISRLWDDSSVDEDDFAVQGSRICGLFLQHCRELEAGSIDREIGVLTQLAVLRLRADSQSMRTVSALVTSLAHLTYVSALTTLTVIDKSLGCTEEVFAVWMSTVNEDRFETVYDRKASAIALTTILGSDWNSLPPVLRQSIPQVLLTVVKLLESLAAPRDENKMGPDGQLNGEMGSNGLTASGHLNTGHLHASLGESGNGELNLAWAKTNNANRTNTFGEMDVSGEAGDREQVVDVVEEGVEEYGEGCDSHDDGDNPMYCVLHDVDELLFFESVVKRLSPVASQQLMTALASHDTQRIQCTLHRAAELRTVQLNNVANV